MPKSEFGRTVSRRNVLKGVAGAATAGATGISMSGPGMAAPGEGVALQYFYESWETITSNLGRVADFGFDAIWIQAPQKSRLDYDHPIYDGRGNPPMGYQPMDLRVFDSVLGTEEELRTLVDTAHNYGLEVYIDTVMNHMAAGQDPKYEFPQFSYEHFHHDSNPDEKTREIYGMPDLKQSSSYVRGELYDYMQKIASVGADGYRFDAALNMPQWFFRDYANPWAEDFGGMFRVAEVFHGDVDLVQNYADTGMACFDYPLFFTMEEEVFRGGDMRKLEGAGLASQDPFSAMPFVDNQDTNPPEQYNLAHAFILTIEGYPMLYNLHTDWLLDHDAIRNMVWVKKNLAGGETNWLYTDADLAAYQRGENLLVGLNNGGAQIGQWVQTSWANAELHDHSGNMGNITTDENGWAYLTIPGGGWTFYAPTGNGGGGIRDGGTYVIRNVNSGKALDVEGAASFMGGNVHQWTYYDVANQHWTAESVGDGYYRLVATHSGHVLDVAGVSQDNGANVQQWEYVDGQNQQWAIEDVDGDGYRITARHSGKALDVAGFATDDGGNVQQWDWYGSDNQRWTFEQV